MGVKGGPKSRALLTSNNSALQQPLHHTDFAEGPPKPNSDHHEFNDDVSGV